MSSHTEEIDSQIFDINRNIAGGGNCISMYKIFSFATFTISFKGSMVPTSLLACVMDISTVSFVIAF
jgi:hypothetical protein